MTDETKNIFDVILTFLTIVLGYLGFRHTISTWKEGQKWQRSQKLDDIINEFENNDLLKLQTVILDWTEREITFKDEAFKYSNDDVLIALTVVDYSKQLPGFSKTQSTIRDCYDAFASFLLRLNTALNSHLIDVKPTASYFRYWLERFLIMDYHPDLNNILKDKTPSCAVQYYLKAYSDAESIGELVQIFDLKKSKQ